MFFLSSSSRPSVCQSLPANALLVACLTLASNLIVVGQNQQATAPAPTATQTLSSAPMAAPDPPKNDPAVFLPAKLANTDATPPLEWKAVSSIKATPLAKLPADKAASLAEYGVKALFSREYSQGTVSVYELQFPVQAYGLFTYLRATQPEQTSFHAGRRVVQISPSSTSSPASAQASALTAVPLDAAFVASVRAQFKHENNEVPPLPAHLPTSQKVAQSELYFYGPQVLAQQTEFNFLKEALQFEGGTEVALASYAQQLRIMLVEFQTPQLATDGLAAVQTKYDALPAEQKARLQLKRIGNYLAVAANVQDVATTQSLLSEIKYELNVYWHGDKLRDIPLAYRPADTTGLNEASETAAVLLRTFYWIGILLLGAIATGIIAGGSYFYWRRHQRRKLGFDNLFSDAGGAVRLNLDEFILRKTERQKLLKKGK